MKKIILALISIGFPVVLSAQTIEVEICHAPVWVKSCTLKRTNATPNRVLGTVAATPFGDHSICKWDVNVLVPLGAGKHILQATATGEDGTVTPPSVASWAYKWNNATTGVSTYVISKPVVCNNTTKICTEEASPVCP